ncbi:unnamed protein product [Enterobius vermicularis]|uniref:Mediator of RNA polymerase II transcription subunit 26 n=1 Tax=Enterobius vermicularis TaxID=51028 RepID=A0A0N4VH19_ENTVE|nr:unnamed protein product [Enterobius vermicularis]
MPSTYLAEQSSGALLGVQEQRRPQYQEESQQQLPTLPQYQHESTQHQVQMQSQYQQSEFQQQMRLEPQYRQNDLRQQVQTQPQYQQDLQTKILPQYLQVSQQQQLEVESQYLQKPPLEEAQAQLQLPEVQQEQLKVVPQYQTPAQIQPMYNPLVQSSAQLVQMSQSRQPQQQKIIGICIFICMPVCDPQCVQTATSRSYFEPTPVYTPPPAIYSPSFTTPEAVTENRSSDMIQRPKMIICIALCMPACNPNCIRENTVRPQFEQVSLPSFPLVTFPPPTVSYQSSSVAEAPSTALQQQQTKNFKKVCILLCMPVCSPSCINQISQQQPIIMQSQPITNRQQIKYQDVLINPFQNLQSQQLQPQLQQVQQEPVAVMQRVQPVQQEPTAVMQQVQPFQQESTAVLQQVEASQQEPNAVMQQMQYEETQPTYLQYPLHFGPQRQFEPAAVVQQEQFQLQSTETANQTQIRPIEQVQELEAILAAQQQLEFQPQYEKPIAAKQQQSSDVFPSFDINQNSRCSCIGPIRICTSGNVNFKCCRRRCRH